MKISSFDSQGKVIEIINFDDFVPDYIKSFDKHHSVLSLFKQVEIKFKKGEAFNNYINSSIAETLFNIDYENFTKSPFTQLKSVQTNTTGTFIETPKYENNKDEKNKLIRIINYFAHKSIQQLDLDFHNGKSKEVECLSNSSWILTLAAYANEKICSNSRSTNKELAFRMSFQTIINRYYWALRNMSHYATHDDVRKHIWKQIQIMSPFISKNLYRAFPQDVLVYGTNKFIHKLVCKLLSNNCIDDRDDAYCLLQLLRGDYTPSSDVNGNLRLQNYEISNKEYSEEPHSYTLGCFDGGKIIVKLSDKELASLLDSNLVGDGFGNLFQTIIDIHEDYKKHLKTNWDSSILARRLAPLHPVKIQCWSYFFFDELSRINGYDQERFTKEQECFHKLIYSKIDYEAPQKIEIDRKLLFDFLLLIKKNGCRDQSGFYEKIYTINQIIDKADLADIKLMSEQRRWNQIESYKNRIEAIDDMVFFLEPILNSSYVNEQLISIDNLKLMIKNILRNDRFLPLTTQKRPRQLLKDIEENRGCTFNCNIALLFNILGALCEHVVSKVRINNQLYLLRERATTIFNELVLPYGIKGDKNNNKFLTRYNQFGSAFSVISSSLETIIVDEMQRQKYYRD